MRRTTRNTTTTKPVKVLLNFDGQQVDRINELRQEHGASITGFVRAIVLNALKKTK